MSLAATLADMGLETLRDVAPVAAVLIGFQVLVLRRRIPDLRRVLLGFVYVILGLALFLKGLDQALFPLGKLMAEQLIEPVLALSWQDNGLQEIHWRDFYTLYLFAFCMGFATTIAEPALIAVAMKAEHVSAGTIRMTGLRVAVAFGVATGTALGTFRIVTGTPLEYYIIAGYVVVVTQTFFAPKFIVPLAYDSGGVSTSTVTVPMIAALGLGLAANIPGRNPILDGFGIIAFACLFPIIAVLAYAQLGEWARKRAAYQQRKSHNDTT